MLALKNDVDCSSQHIANQIVVLAAGKNEIGSIHLNHSNVLYSKTENQGKKKGRIHTA